MFTIKKATTNDIQLINEMAQIVFPATYREILSKEQLDYMMDWMYSPKNLRKQMEEEGHIYYIAYKDGEAAGYVSIQPEGEHLFHLQKIYVLPLFQGCRLGKALFEQAVKAIKEIHPGPCEMHLNVNRNNKALQFYQHLGMEERMLQGMVISNLKMKDTQAYLSLVARFIAIINSWSVCDTFDFYGKQRFVDKNKKRVWLFLEDRMKSDKEYEIRFGVVMAMAHYIDEEYIDNVLQWMDRISHEGYYVKMAVAWALSVCYVKFPQKTMNYLKENHLDDFTYNKALQKIIESYRVSTEDKEIIRSMKRKNK
jgi:3-methyladenine DNA glycosylase AlkD/N-acetylglutamate synthase-like GNAT family acetyltransferase